MYEHLLVALDGSPTAERVLEYVEPLATAFGSTITLIRATVAAETLLAQTTNSGQSIGDMTPLTDPTPVLEAEREAASGYLEGVAARLRQRNLNVVAECPPGAAGDVIVDRAGVLGASLILMTTHGRGGLGRMVFGSVADSVLRHAPCPVLLVRLKEPDTSDPQPPLRTTTS